MSETNDSQTEEGAETDDKEGNATPPGSDKNSSDSEPSNLKETIKEVLAELGIVAGSAGGATGAASGSTPGGSLREDEDRLRSLIEEGAARVLHKAEHDAQHAAARSQRVSEQPPIKRSRSHRIMGWGEPDNASR